MRVSLQTVLAIAVAFFVAAGVTSVWVPSAIVATRSIVDAREDQLVASVRQTSGRVHEYWGTVFAFVDTWAWGFNLSMVEAPDNAVEHFRDENMAALWMTVRGHPFINLMLISSLRDPAILANQTQRERECDGDGLAVESNAIFIVTPELTRNGTFNKTSIVGAEKPYSLTPNPFETTATPTWQCRDAVVSSSLLWHIQYFKDGNLTAKDTGVRNTQFAGYTTYRDHVAMVLLFPLKGPRWAPLSAWGLVGIQASNSGLPSPEGATSVGDMLVEAAESSAINELLFLLMDDGNIVASSIPDLSLDLRTAGNTTIGLLRADNASAMPPMIQVPAHGLINSSCTARTQSRKRDRTGRKKLFDHGFWKVDCTWDNVPAVQQIDKYTVATGGMGIGGQRWAMVAVLETAAITEDADNLNKLLIAIGAIVVVAFSLVSLGFAHSIAKPIKEFVLEMEDVAVMRVDDKVVVPPTSWLSEVHSLERSMIDVVKNMKELKGYMPQAVLVTLQTDDEDNDSDNNNTNGTSSVNDTRTSHSSHSRQVEARHGLGVGSVQSKQIGVAVANLSNWRGSGYAADLHTEFVTFITSLAQATRGIPETFVGDSFTVTFNASRACSAIEEHICKFLYQCNRDARRPSSLSRISAAGIKGSCKVGPFGIPSMMRFSFMGTIVGHVCALERYCAAIGANNVVLELLAERCPTFHFLKLGMFAYRRSQREEKEQYVCSVVKESEGQNDEWMYELAGKQGSDVNFVWNTAVGAMACGKWAEARDNLARVASPAALGVPKSVSDTVSSSIAAGEVIEVFHASFGIGKAPPPQRWRPQE